MTKEYVGNMENPKSFYSDSSHPVSEGGKAAARTGALVAFVLGKTLERALLLLRSFLRARSRFRSVGAPGLVSYVLR